MPHHPRRPTMKEVANIAGVSTQTVSRVVNGKPDVSPKTRQRIQEIIEELGYQPSALARSLIRQRSYTLGVVTAGLKYIGPSRTLSGITSAAEKAGYSLLLKELPGFASDGVEPILSTLLSRHVDGIIWAVPEVGDNRNWLSELQNKLEIPLVILTMTSREKIHIVTIDNYLGGRLAVSHLIDSGYKNIGHISGPLDWWEARERMAAWKDVIAEAGRPVHDDHWEEGTWSPSSGARAFLKLLETYPEMDAIFVANDQMALGVLQVAYQEGISVPEELAVVGFDNIPEAEFFLPPLTTIQQDLHKVGGVAVQEVTRIIEAAWEGDEPEEYSSFLVAPSLVVRESSTRT
jgi:LacI family transcriptional regulator